MFGEPQLNWGFDSRAASHHVIAAKKEELGLGICSVPFTVAFDPESGLMPNHLIPLLRKPGVPYSGNWFLLADSSVSLS